MTEQRDLGTPKEEGLTDEEMMAMADAAAEFTRLAHEHNAGAMIFHPYAGPPPTADFFLGIMREMVDETGDAMGSICVGVEGESGMLPLTDIHPVDALHAIVHARLEGILPKIHWVTLACDTYTFLTTNPDVRRGTAREAFEAGDPEASEALMALCVAPDGPGYDIHQPYRRMPHEIDWGEPEQMPGGDSIGDVPNLMKELVLA